MYVVNLFIIGEKNSSSLIIKIKKITPTLSTFGFNEKVDVEESEICHRPER